ncbi:MULTISPECIES: phage holin family protein [Gammaproteobacteria]|uniref:phage holin family protein n=1 Tax=Acinetobacter sp. HRXRD-152 TaxID=3404808 RepID=UPI003BB54772
MEKFIFAVFSTGISFLFGSWHISLTVLCVLMVLDILTGILKGAINKELRSRTGYVGFLRKASIMIVIIMANMLDLITKTGMPVFRTIAVYFYVGMEGISIIENLGLMGVPLPSAITKYFEQLKSDNDNKDMAQEIEKAQLHKADEGNELSNNIK